MSAVFADTFYWAALTSTEGEAHRHAISLSRLLKPDEIVTTDEVLCEYLAFFAGARASIRTEAGRTVAELIENPAVRVMPQSRATASSIAFPWKRCVVKD